MALTTTVLLSIVLSDLYWIASAKTGRIALPGLERAMTREIVFVMAVLLIEAVNLTLSYSRNLKLLFDNQTTVLARVSDGDLTGFVPAVTNDELGFIAGHTNLMIDGLKDRSRLAEGMAVAREIQLNLLPGEPPLVPGLDMAGASVSSDENRRGLLRFHLFKGKGRPDHPGGRRVRAWGGGRPAHGLGPGLHQAPRRPARQPVGTPRGREPNAVPGHQRLGPVHDPVHPVLPPGGRKP